MSIRRVIVEVLVIAGVLTGVLGAVSVYSLDKLLDSDEAAERAVAALAEPEVREFIGENVVQQIVSANPDFLGAQILLEQIVSAAIAAPAFRPIYEAAIRDLHRTLILGELDTLSVQLSDMVLIVRTQAAVLSPDVSAQIPDDLTDMMIEIQSHPLIADAAQISNDIRVLAFVLPLLSLLAFCAAILLSGDRLQAWVRVGLGVMVIGLLLLVGEAAAGTLFPLGFEGEEERAVASAIWRVFAGDISLWGLVLAAFGVIVVVAVWWTREPSDAAARLGKLRRFMEPPAGKLPRLLWVSVWILIGGLLIFDWQGVVQVIAILSGAVLIANALAELLRMITPEQIADAALSEVPAGRPGLRGMLNVVAAGVAVIAVIAAGYFFIERSGGSGVASATFDSAFDPACNGHVLLCERSLDNITTAATHNSMSSAEGGFTLSNHSRGIIPQLEAGYRGLMIDLHYGIASERSRLVVTDIAPPTEEERQAMIEQLGAAAVSSAEELRRRNLAADGVKDIYMCHVMCELGAVLFSGELELIRDWLEHNPREVLLIIIEDHVAPQGIEAAFESAGLVQYTHTQALGEQWPTLLEMIDSGRRLVVMAEKDTGGVPWYHDAFTFVQETPYSFQKVEDFDCAPNRGNADSPLFMVNHWVTPALAGAGAIANSAAILEERIADCREERGLVPNILGVDFYAEGDAPAVAAKLNGILEENSKE